MDSKNTSRRIHRPRSLEEPVRIFEVTHDMYDERQSKRYHDKARGKGKEKQVEADSTTSNEAQDEYHEKNDNFMLTSLVPPRLGATHRRLSRQQPKRKELPMKFVGQMMKDNVDYRESINKIKLTPTFLIDYSTFKAPDLDDDVVWMLDALGLRRMGSSISRSTGNTSTSLYLALEEHFGFDYQDAIDFGPEEHGDIWHHIGRGPFTSGKTKSAMISHPAKRYIHKLLANTIFARTVQNSILGDELLVLKTPFVDFPRRVNYASLFAERMVKIKHDAIYCTDDQAFLSFGGVITTILEAARVDLTDRAFTAEEHYLDLERLGTMKILEGACIDPDRFGYRYHVPPRLIHTIMLPCPTISRLRDGATRWDPDSSEFLSLQSGERLLLTLTGFIKKKALDSRRTTKATRSHESESSSHEEERARSIALEQHLAEQIALTEQMERMIRDPRH
ncbi:unnamed protein product [Arabidopsis lyrata]|nr:unnamed protein product [Arabidopsis lyrata]